MTAPPETLPFRESLRSKIFLVGILTALVAGGGALGLGMASLEARSALTQATSSFVEEQRIADRITQGVMQQLATASALSGQETELQWLEFQRTGDQVHADIRRYLFRDLTTPERLELEAMAEEHQRMEVAAARALDQELRGESEEARLSREGMFLHLQDFLAATGRFLDLRGEALEGIRERQDATFQTLYLGGGVLALLISGGFFLLVGLLNRRITTPLEELARASEELAQGNLGVRVDEGQDRELQVVSEGFNRMAASLERATTRLERRNQELEMALSSLRETQDELIQAEKLAAMGRMTAGLAHELNNPLASVLGYSQLLDRHLADTDQVDPTDLSARFLDPIVQEAGRARKLVRSFLQLSRRTGPDLGPVGLDEAVEVAASLQRYAFRQDGLTLEVDDLPDVQVKAERQMLQAVILNLVSNARDAMATQARGTLRIHGRIEGREVVLNFDDHGPGFEDGERLFEPFFTTKSVGEGTGLGLALVHRFTTLFGGRVQALNRPEGGARFTLYLPLAQAAETSNSSIQGQEGPQPALPRPGPDNVRGGASTGRQNPNPSEPPAPPTHPSSNSDHTDHIRGVQEVLALPQVGEIPSTSPTSAPGNPALVLIVEDEAPLRRLQKRLVERLGAQVILAQDTAEARKVVDTRHPDFILSDVKMPGESGFEFYQWLRRHGSILAQRFLFVTGNVTGDELSHLSQERPELFIHKPFDIAEYLERVGDLLVHGMVRPPTRAHADRDPPAHPR